MSSRKVRTSGRSKRRPWLKRLPRGAIKITPRDVEIIKAVHSYRFLSTSQIKRRFFRSKSKADRRLRRLFDYGFLDRIQLPVTQGRGELLYALWKQGTHLLAERLDKTLEEIGWRPKMNKLNPYHLKHELNLNQFRFTLEEAAVTNNEYSILLWKQGADLRSPQSRFKPLLKFYWRRSAVILIPDALFALKGPKGRAFFFLEIDRATETKPTIFRKKMAHYSAYYKSGTFSKQFSHKKFRVLTVTISQRRLLSLIQNIKDLDHAPMFWFTTLEHISPDKFFAKIWATPHNSDKLMSL